MKGDGHVRANARRLASCMAASHGHDRWPPTMRGSVAGQHLSKCHVLAIRMLHC